MVSGIVADSRTAFSICSFYPVFLQAITFERILWWSHCQPYLVQLLCALLAERMNKTGRHRAAAAGFLGRSGRCRGGGALGFAARRGLFRRFVARAGGRGDGAIAVGGAGRGGGFDLGLGGFALGAAGCAGAAGLLTDNIPARDIIREDNRMPAPICYHYDLLERHSL